MTTQDTRQGAARDDAHALPARPVPAMRLFGFALGSMGGGLFSTLPGLLLLFYLTDTLGVPAAIAGLVVLIPKAWDVLFNPIVGALSDREALRTGRRTRLMLIGALTMPLGMALMFASPATGMAGATWVFLAFFLAATSFACFQVPYITLPAEMSPDPSERTRIMGWRIIAVTLGVLLAGGLAPLVITLAGGGQTGHRWMGLGAAILLFAAYLTAALTTRWVRAHPGSELLGLKATFAMARGNRAFLVLVAAYGVQVLATAMMLAAITYVASYLLNDYSLTSALFATFVAPSILAVPLWTRLATRFGKPRVYQMVTLLLAAGAAAMWLAVRSGDTTLVLAVMLLQGIAFAGQQVLPWAMLPDAILADQARTGRVQAGAFSGAFSAMETAMFAIGPGAFSVVLVVTGFVSSTQASPVAQSPLALSGILAGGTIIPALLLLVTLPIISLYRNTDAARIGTTGHAGSGAPCPD
jgi:Na+/melibiose symporter-like transporter